MKVFTQNQIFRMALILHGTDNCKAMGLKDASTVSNEILDKIQVAFPEAYIAAETRQAFRKTLMAGNFGASWYNHCPNGF